MFVSVNTLFVLFDISKDFVAKWTQAHFWFLILKVKASTFLNTVEGRSGFLGGYSWNSHFFFPCHFSIITCKNFNGLNEGMGLEMEYGTFWLADCGLDVGMMQSPPLQWRTLFNHTLPFTCRIYSRCCTCALFFVNFFACKDLEEFERHLWLLQVAFQEHLYHRLAVGLYQAESPCWTNCVLQPKQKK